jgi:hypothetical protein
VLAAIGGINPSPHIRAARERYWRGVPAA